MIVFANKISVQINDVARLILVDERSKVDGLDFPLSPTVNRTVGEVVLTIDNLAELYVAIGSCLDQLKAAQEATRTQQESDLEHSLPSSRKVN